MSTWLGTTFLWVSQADSRNETKTFNIKASYLYDPWKIWPWLYSNPWKYTSEKRQRRVEKVSSVLEEFIINLLASSSTPRTIVLTCLNTDHSLCHSLHSNGHLYYLSYLYYSLSLLACITELSKWSRLVQHLRNELLQCVQSFSPAVVLRVFGFRLTCRNDICLI